MSWRRSTILPTKYKINDDYTQKFNKYRFTRLPLFRLIASSAMIVVLATEAYLIEYSYRTSEIVERDYNCVKQNQQIFDHLILSHMD